MTDFDELPFLLWGKWNDAMKRIHVSYAMTSDEEVYGEFYDGLLEDQAEEYTAIFFDLLTEDTGDDPLFLEEKRRNEEFAALQEEKAFAIRQAEQAFKRGATLHEIEADYGVSPFEFDHYRAGDVLAEEHYREKRIRDPLDPYY